jgi:hypothetical protein
MHKIWLFAVTATLIVAGAAGWIATTTYARVKAPVSAEWINPSQIMLNATNLPVEHFDDLSLTF